MKVLNTGLLYSSDTFLGIFATSDHKQRVVPSIFKQKYEVFLEQMFREQQ